MKVLYRLLLLWLLSLCSRAQLPFWLQRFRPRQPSSLLSSASTSYPNAFFPSSSFSSPSYFSDPSFGSSLTDFGSSAGHFEGGYDQSELLDDYPGFSNAGFAKDLNFAGSHPLSFRSHSYAGGGGGGGGGGGDEPLFFLQRE